MGHTHPKLEKLFYADVETELTASATGSFEFGLSVYGSAILYIDGKQIIDNCTTQRGGTFHFGKGTLEEKATVDLVEGQVYKIKVEFASASSSKLVKPGVVNFGCGAGRLGMIQKVDDDVAIAAAVEAAKNAEITILCAGLSRDQESEGFDRPHMQLPRAVPRLFAAVLAAAPDTIVVTQSGTPFDMLPWADTVKTHVHSWFGGNETGNGIADVLFGAVNPVESCLSRFPGVLRTPRPISISAAREAA